MEFKMSLVDELACFQGLEVKQIGNVTFISQSKYAKNRVNKIGLEIATYCLTPIGNHAKIGKDVVQSLY